ncbi:MAG: PAS-domain containing protein [Rhodospirillales bacterium]|nr:PAS-domain containing protein [Rhodospirillales bacterium]
MTVLGPFLIGVAVAGIPAAYGLLRLIKKSRRQESGLKAEEARAFALEQTLVGIPDGYYQWAADQIETCSSRLAVLLNLEKGVESQYSDILAAFEPELADQLDRAIAALHRDNKNFDLFLPLADGRRVVQAVGASTLTKSGEALGHILWMRDASKVVETGGSFSQNQRGLIADSLRLKTISSSVDFPIWFRDGELNRVFTNEACPREDVSRALAHKALTAGVPLSEVTSVKVSGLPHLFEITEAPLPEGAGTIGIALDTTSFDQEPSDLAPTLDPEAEGAILQNLSTAVAMYDGDMRLTFFNAAFNKLWGLDGEWLSMGPSYGDILERLRERRRLPEYANFKAFKEEQLKLFDELDSVLETMLHLPDNASLRCVVSPEPQGGLVFTYEDVTDRLELESSYKTLLAVQRETLDNLYEGVAVFGPDGRLELSNPSFVGMWQLDPNDLLERPHLSDIVEATRMYYREAHDWPKFKDSLLSWLMSRETNSGKLERSDGTVLEYASVPLPDGATLLSYLDISDGALVERALRERAEALHTADRLKSEFIANLSYEVRTPLNTIVGFSEILSEEYFGKLNEKQQEYSKGIKESSDTLLSLFNDILDLATIEAGQMALELDTVELHTLLVNVLGLIRERTRQRKIKLDFNCSPDIGWFVADEKRMKQVLFHLLSNAVKFTQAEGCVTLSASRKKDEIVIQVSDTGIGISESDQKRVSESLERGYEAETRDQAGAGLGLTLVKRFVELHGGRLDIQSEANKGTTVTCYLPGG